MCAFFGFLPGLSSTQLFPLLVLLSAVCRARIHSLFSFFSWDLFFAFLFLAVLFLAIYRAVFIYLVHFFKACAWAFPSLVIPLISGIVRAHHFSYSSLGFFVGLLVPRFLFFLVLLFLASAASADLSSENACY